jgi:hypothetical protein
MNGDIESRLEQLEKIVSDLQIDVREIKNTLPQNDVLDYNMEDY